MPLLAKDSIDIWACRHPKTKSVYFRLIRSDRVWPKGKQVDHWFYASVWTSIDKGAPMCRRAKEIDRFIIEKKLSPRFYATKRAWMDQWERELVETDVTLRSAREYLTRQARKHTQEGWFVLNGRFGPFKIEF